MAGPGSWGGGRVAPGVASGGAGNPEGPAVSTEDLCARFSVFLRDSWSEGLGVPDVSHHPPLHPLHKQLGKRKSLSLK